MIHLHLHHKQEKHQQLASELHPQWLQKELPSQQQGQLAELKLNAARDLCAGWPKTTPFSPPTSQYPQEASMSKRKGKSREYIDDSDDSDDTGVGHLPSQTLLTFPTSPFQAKSKKKTKLKQQKQAEAASVEDEMIQVRR